jgi:DNA-nicking Smr family endonuclease
MSKLDLHGYKIHNAWKEFSKHVTECYFNNIKQTTIITGQGKIAEEIIAWVHANQYCKTAERNDNNSGAVVVHIRKNKDNQKASTIEKPKVDLSPLLKKFGSY